MKNLPKELLLTMADGLFHSGESLGELLGVSRVAVWKQLQKLDEIGLQVESVKGKGYRLSRAIQFLSEDQLSETLHRHLKDATLQVFDVLDSSNAELLRQLNTSNKRLPRGSCVLAEMQLAGRGRRGRQWISPYARNIYFSLLWDFEQGMAHLDGLSLVVGLSVLQALNSQVQAAYQLKWPNDILVAGKKLAGILLEVTGEAGGLCHVVIGIGVNVNWQDRVQGEEISQPWLSLAELAACDVDRNLVLAAMIERLAANLALFEFQGFAPFKQAWQSYDAFYSKQVVVQLGDNYLFGESKGVNDKGELVLATDVGLQTFNGGEVSLRIMR